MLSAAVNDDARFLADILVVGALVGILKSAPEKHGGKMIGMAKRLRRKMPKGGRRSLRTVADELAKAGYRSESGKPYAATAIGRMLGEIK